MSSPSSQQSSPPSYNNNNNNNNNRDQAIVANNKKMSDEEVQLLHANSDEDEYGDNNNNFDVPLKNVKSRYTSAPFIWFVTASTILPLIIIITAFTMDPDTPFSLAFVLGIITCIFGGCYFVPHLAIKKELIDIYAENQKKRMHADEIRGDVNKLNKLQSELSKTRQNIMNNNKETKNLLANLQMMNIDSLEELNEQKGKAQKIYQEWFHQLLKKERVLLHTLYDRFEFMDDSPGMTKQEFKKFIANLPDGYEQRMKRLGTFEKLSKGDGIISYQDFKSALDVFAEMELNDEDIDFEIEKQETGIDDTGNKTFVHSIIKKSTKARRLVQNKWFTDNKNQQQ